MFAFTIGDIKTNYGPAQVHPRQRILKSIQVLKTMTNLAGRVVKNKKNRSTANGKENVAAR